jgi:hypothetical protein
MRSIATFRPRLFLYQFIPMLWQVSPLEAQVALQEEV